MSFNLQETRYQDPKNFFQSAFQYALVGEALSADKIGFQIFFAMEKAGYRIIPVNKGEKMVCGAAAIPSIEQIAPPPDGVILAAGEKECIESIEQMRNRGVYRVWVQKGFGSEALRSLCKAYDMEAYIGYSIFEVLQDIEHFA